MKQATLEHLLRLYVAITVPRTRDERGDVPGWVMVTVMTVAIAIAIWTVAEDRLAKMLTAAFDSVK